MEMVLLVLDEGFEILIRRDRIDAVSERLPNSIARGSDNYTGPLVNVHVEKQWWAVRGSLEEVARKLGLIE